MTRKDDYLVIEDVITDLAAKQAWLSDYIEAHMDDLTPSLLVRVLQLHGQNASRLGKLLRDQRELSGQISDGLAAIIDKTLDEVSEILGTEL